MCWRILTKLRQVKIFLSRDWLTLTVVPPPLVDCIANENKFSVQLQMTGHRTEPWKQPIETKNRGSSVGSSPHRAGSRLADAALRICFGDPLARSEQEEPHSRYCRRVDPLARLSLGTRKVLSFVDWSQESRRPDNSEHAASSVLLCSGSPLAGFFTGYYWEMGAVAIFQAVMYFFSILGLRALARKREANGASNERTEE